MAFSSKIEYGAGTVTEYEDPATPDTWILLDEMEEIGEMGAIAEAKDTSNLVDITDQYSAGPKTGADLDFKFNHKPGVAKYAAFLVLARAAASVRMRFTYPSGDIATVTVLLLGTRLSSAQRKEKLTMSVPAKQSGEVEWSETA